MQVHVVVGGQERQRRRALGGRPPEVLAPRAPVSPGPSRERRRQVRAPGNVVRRAVHRLRNDIRDERLHGARLRAGAWREAQRVARGAHHLARRQDASLHARLGEVERLVPDGRAETRRVVGVRRRPVHRAHAERHAHGAPVLGVEDVEQQVLHALQVGVRPQQGRGLLRDGQPARHRDAGDEHECQTRDQDGDAPRHHERAQRVRDGERRRGIGSSRRRERRRFRHLGARRRRRLSRSLVVGFCRFAFRLRVLADIERRFAFRLRVAPASDVRDALELQLRAERGVRGGARNAKNRRRAARRGAEALRAYQQRRRQERQHQRVVGRDGGCRVRAERAHGRDVAEDVAPERHGGRERRRQHSLRGARETRRERLLRREARCVFGVADARFERVAHDHRVVAPDADEHERHERVEEGDERRVGGDAREEERRRERERDAQHGVGSCPPRPHVR